MSRRREQLRSMTAARSFEALKLLIDARATAMARDGGRLHDLEVVIDMLDEAVRLAIRKASR